MSRFQPARTSSPSKADTLLDASSVLDASLSSAAIPELSNLSPDDIHVLDAIINRAGPSSNTFLTVFTAYNTIIKERGLDPHEVLYYGKLLKLGTMKGKNWGEKWNAVRTRHGYRNEPDASGGDVKRSGRARPMSYTPESLPARVARERSPLSTSRKTLSSRAQPITHPSQGLVRRPRGHTIHSEPSTSVLDDDAESDYLPTPVGRPNMAPARRTFEQSDSDNSYVLSTTPPSYRAATRHTRSIEPSSSKRLITNIGRAQGHLTTINHETGRTQSVVDEAGAWDKIRVQRDEAQADVYRRERLVERCWEVWKQGFQWIITTNDQIVEARNNLVIRISFQRWRSVARSRRDLYQRISALSHRRCLEKTLKVWQARLRERGQEKWRQSMQQKKIYVQENRARNLRKNAWARWCQSYRSHLSRHHYERGLVHRFYYSWKRRLSFMIGLEHIADNFGQVKEGRVVERYWNLWKQARELRIAEQIIAERVELRLIGEAMFLWQKNARDYKTSLEVHRRSLIKATIQSWRVHQHRIQIMESRAHKHFARQSSVLLRAIFRIWKARERGALLERVKAARLMKATWLTWQQKLQRIKRKNDLADAVALRLDLEIAIKAFHKWHDVFMTHKNAYAFAVLFDASQVRYRIILAWRIELRQKLKTAKVARMTNQFFTIRRSWKAWRDALAVKDRENRLQEFLKRRLQTAFHSWVSRFQSRRQQYMAEQTIKGYVNKRALRVFLAIWTNRVIEIKVRELEVAQDFDLAIQITAFKRWHTAYCRHAEQLSLMENYLMVKAEENIRRIFSRWLTLARITRYRRVSLKEKEDEIKLSAIAASWDKWRDRFSNERLRPIEYEVLVQTQRNALFRAFGAWYSRTKSLPAIRFYVKTIKLKYFKVWRQTIPKALQAKEARERDKKTILSEYLARWLRSYRTRVALKAVARARYLRLPTTRQTPPISASAAKNPYIFSRPTAQRSTPKKEMDTMPVQADIRREMSGLIRDKLITRDLDWRTSTPKRIEPSPERTRSSLVDFKFVRDNSPPLKSSLSDAGKSDGQRSMLWHGLREVGKKSRPRSVYSRARSP